MNKYYLMIISCIVSFQCFADVAVQFDSSINPILKAGQNDSSDNEYLDDDVLVQLIWSSELNDYQSSTSLDSSLTREGEVVLNTNTDNSYGLFSSDSVSVFTDSDVGGEDINAGYLYARIFDSAVPTFGSYYLEMGLQGFGLFEYDFLNPSTIISDDFNDLGGIVSIDHQNTYIKESNTNQPPQIISLTVSNSVGGTVSPTGTTIYYQPTLVTVEAEAEFGYVFSAWVDENENAYPYDNPANLTISSDQLLIALFGPDLSDEDEDGLSLYDEVLTYGSDPTLSDTSGDGLSDGILVSMGLNPLVNFSNVISTVQSSPELFGVYGAAFVDQLKDSITNLTELTLSQSNQIVTIESMLAEVEAQLANTIDEKSQLESEVTELNIANVELTASVNSLTEQNNGLLIQVDDLQLANSALNDANQNLESTISDLNTQNASLTSSITELEALNTDLASQVAALSTNANANLLDQIATLESTNSILTGLVAELEGDIEGLEDIIFDLELEVADLEEALEDAYVSYDKPDWIWNNWHYPWYKPNNYWWGWGNPPARYLPKWGREATVGKRVKMKRLKKRWKNNRQQELAELEVELCVESATDLVSGEWSSTTNQVMIDIPVDNDDVKFYRVNYR